MLPSSGELQWSDFQTEFGGSYPISMSEYYGKSTLPASGEIRAGNFYGTTNVVVPGITSVSYYYWAYSNTSGYSQNHSHSSSSYVQWTATNNFTVSWSVSSENNYDYLTVRKNGSQIWRAAGNAGGSTTVVSGNVMYFNYYKDGSVSTGADTAYYTNTG